MLPTLARVAGLRDPLPFRGVNLWAGHYSPSTMSYLGVVVEAGLIGRVITGWLDKGRWLDGGWRISDNSRDMFSSLLRRGKCSGDGCDDHRIRCCYHRLRHRGTHAYASPLNLYIDQMRTGLNVAWYVVLSSYPDRLALKRGVKVNSQDNRFCRPIAPR